MEEADARLQEVVASLLKEHGGNYEPALRQTFACLHNSALYEAQSPAEEEQREHEVLAVFRSFPFRACAPVDNGVGSRVEETQATPSNYSASYVNAGGSNHANGCGANTNANGSYASHGNASNLATTTSASGACSSNSSSSSSNIREPEEAGEIVAEEGDPENVGELPSATVPEAIPPLYPIETHGEGGESAPGPEFSHQRESPLLPQPPAQGSPSASDDPEGVGDFMESTPVLRSEVGPAGYVTTGSGLQHHPLEASYPGTSSNGGLRGYTEEGAGGEWGEPTRTGHGGESAEEGIESLIATVEETNISISAQQGEVRELAADMGRGAPEGVYNVGASASVVEHLLDRAAPMAMGVENDNMASDIGSADPESTSSVKVHQHPLAARASVASSANGTVPAVSSTGGDRTPLESTPSAVPPASTRDSVVVAPASSVSGAAPRPSSSHVGLPEAFAGGAGRAVAEPHLKTGGQPLMHGNRAESPTTMSTDLTAKLKALKIRRRHRFVVMRIDGTEVVAETVGAPGEGPGELRVALPYSDCRYAVYDQEVVTTDGRKTSKLFFFTWLPHNSTPHNKMAYSHGKATVRQRLEGLYDVAASSFADIEVALGLVDEDEEDSDIDF